MRNDSAHEQGRLNPPLELRVLFALYLSFLIAFFIICDTVPYETLSGRTLYLWTPHAVALTRMNFVLSYTALLFLPAIPVLICVVLLGRYSVGAVIIRVLMAATAVLGLPLVCLYKEPNWGFSIELVIVAVMITMWLRGLWPLSKVSTVLLLFVHYALWLVFGLLALGFASRRIDWWSDWDYLSFLFPVAGLAYSLFWSKYAHRQLNWR